MAGDDVPDYLFANTASGPDMTFDSLYRHDLARVLGRTNVDHLLVLTSDYAENRLLTSILGNKCATAPS